MNDLLNQDLKNYFDDLLQCYSDARTRGTAVEISTMSVEVFQNLAPADRGAAMRHPLRLVGSAPQQVFGDHRCGFTCHS